MTQSQHAPLQQAAGFGLSQTYFAKFDFTFSKDKTVQGSLSYQHFSNSRDKVVNSCIWYRPVQQI